jgi:glycosyltransferase involved in cell wall biosynthesis
MDLSQAADGYVGTARDARAIFTMLAELPEVELTGLMMPARPLLLPRVGPHASPSVEASIIYALSRQAAPPQILGRIKHIKRKIAEWREVRRDEHLVQLIADKMRDNAIWRVLFEPTTDRSLRERVLGCRFAVTDLNVSFLMRRLSSKRPSKLLETQGFDAVLFNMPRPVRVAPGTAQIMRYHDAIPVTDPDTMVDWSLGALHEALVRRCDPAAHFVCNSPQSLQDLVFIDPRRERFAHVIPCCLPANEAPDVIEPSSIVESHATWRALGSAPTDIPPFRPGTRYVLATSALDPRKNLVSAIRAWQHVAATVDPELELVVVAGPGWLEEETLAVMAPAIRRGKLRHLQHVPKDELRTLMRRAECFVFPSFAEGFGYPPLEALSVGTPVIVSDLPIFRWTLDDAALFIDPADVTELATAITRLTADPARDSLRRDLAQRAAAVLPRFSEDTVRAQWREVLERVLPARR